MNIPRIDLIGQNGGDGEHYKYEEVAEKILKAYPYLEFATWEDVVKHITKILVENFHVDDPS